MGSNKSARTFISLYVSARYIQPEDTVCQNTGMTDGALGSGRDLWHNTPVESQMTASGPSEG